MAIKIFSVRSPQQPKATQSCQKQSFCVAANIYSPKIETEVVKIIPIISMVNILIPFAVCVKSRKHIKQALCQPTKINQTRK